VPATGGRDYSHTLERGNGFVADHGHRLFQFDGVRGHGGTGEAFCLSLYQFGTGSVAVGVAGSAVLF